MKDKILDVEITIKFSAQEDFFDRRELILDIRRQFTETTGYDLEDIEVETSEQLTWN